MPVTLDWLGCATFRLTIDDLVLSLDACIDRVPSAPRRHTRPGHRVYGQWLTQS